MVCRVSPPDGGANGGAGGERQHTTDRAARHPILLKNRAGRREQDGLLRGAFRGLTTLHDRGQQ